MTSTLATPTSVSPATYGYIRSHMVKHQRVTTLVTLSPGDDFVDGIPCDSEADAEERADGMGIVLVKSGVLNDMVDARRKAATPTSTYDPQLWLRHSTPSAAERAQYRAEAAALLADAPVQPHETLDADEGAGDTEITVGDRVSYFPPGAWDSRTASVEAIRADGQLLLRFAFSGLRWAWIDDVTLLLKAEAAEVGMG